MRKALVTGAGAPLRIVEEEVPDVPPKGALVRTQYAGICHSDLHFIDDEMDIGNGVIFRRRDFLGDKFTSMCLGHEISGVIEKIGKEADVGSQQLSVGDKVCVYAWIGCQECVNCKGGLTNSCLCPENFLLHVGCGVKYDGGFSTHVRVPKTCFLVKVPDSIPMEVACMLPCSASTAFGSLIKAAPTVNEAVEIAGSASILVIGAGALGLWCTTLAKKSFFPEKVKVVVADISAAKANAAKRAGADEVVIWNREMSEQEMILKATGGGNRKFDAVLNYVGSTTSAQVGVMSLLPRGMQVIIGLFGGEVTASLPYMVISGIKIVGILTSTLAELRDLVDVVKDKGLTYPVIKYFTLDEVNKGLEELKAGKIEGRGIIAFDQKQ